MNKIQWNLNYNIGIFIQENMFENVICKMAAILCGSVCYTVVLRPMFDPDQNIVSIWVINNCVICLLYSLVSYLLSHRAACGWPQINP